MKTIILLALVLLRFSLNAQFKEIEDAMSKGRQKGICLHYDTINKAIAYDALIKTISEKDHNVSGSIISFNELIFDNANIPSISNNPIDIYTKYNDSNKSILLFVDIGSAFIDGAKYPKEALVVQSLGTEIINQVRAINKQNNKDSLIRKTALLKDSLEKITNELKIAYLAIKTNTKQITKNNNDIIENETELLKAQSQIRAIDSLQDIKEKEFNEFPLERLKSENSLKNKALDKNKSMRKNLLKSNSKSKENIAEYETEILLNNTSLAIVKDDVNASNKLTKSNQKLVKKINNEHLNITLNDASIKTISKVITTDSLIVKKNQDSLDAFDENGRRNAQKQLENKKDKLEKKSEKNLANISECKLKSSQHTLENETLILKAEGLKITQAHLLKKLEETQLELTNIEKR